MLSARGDTYIHHSRVVDVHCLLRISSTVLVVEIDAGIVDKHINAAVLCDFFRKASDTIAIRDVQLRIYHTTSGVIRLETQVLSGTSSCKEL